MNQDKRQERCKTILRIIKRIVSWVVGLPALIIIASESESESFFWVQLAAIFALLAVLKWNHVFDE